MPEIRGCFITFEGPEGSGKSTQARRLVARLQADGVQVRSTREPGGTATGELIRDILQHGRSGETLCAEAELLLFCASRAQLVDRVIRPALARAEWVVCDRFYDSTTAYQAYGCGLDVPVVEAIHGFTVGTTMPDRTFLLDLPVAESLRRMQSRNAAQAIAPDRFERETAAFHQKVHDGYRTLARRYPRRFRVVDATRPETEVADQIWKELHDVRNPPD